MSPLDEAINRLITELGRSDLLIITEAKKELAALREAAQPRVQPTDGSLCKDCGHSVEIKQVAGCLEHPVIG